MAYTGPASTGLLSFKDTSFSAAKVSAAERAEWKQSRKEISAVLNVLASMVAVAVAAWWASGNASAGQVRLSYCS